MENDKPGCSPDLSAEMHEVRLEDLTVSPTIIAQPIISEAYNIQIMEHLCD